MDVISQGRMSTTKKSAVESAKGSNDAKSTKRRRNTIQQMKNDADFQQFRVAHDKKFQEMQIQIRAAEMLEARERRRDRIAKEKEKQ